ncbi:hypothetical protein F4780DRAFT_669511 [Xylariomycetidae sp. FL0641]|nr:hypothetical protein F4780DRAFT_669511 [Xylariomycetidae sp. FL0641]
MTLQGEVHQEALHLFLAKRRTWRWILPHAPKPVQWVSPTAQPTVSPAFSDPGSPGCQARSRQLQACQAAPPQDCTLLIPPVLPSFLSLFHRIDTHLSRLFQPVIGLHRNCQDLRYLHYDTRSRNSLQAIIQVTRSGAHSLGRTSQNIYILRHRRLLSEECCLWMFVRVCRSPERRHSPAEISVAQASLRHISEPPEVTRVLGSCSRSTNSGVRNTASQPALSHQDAL